MIRNLFVSYHAPMEVSLPGTVSEMLTWVTKVHGRRKMLPDIFRHDKNPFISAELKSATNPADLQTLLNSCWEGRLWLANFVEGTRSQQDFPLRLECILRRAGITMVCLDIDEEPGLNLDDLGPAARDARMEVTKLELKEVRAEHKSAKASTESTRAGNIAALARDLTLVPLEGSLTMSKNQEQILGAVGRDLADIYGISPSRLTAAWVLAYQKCAPQYDRMCRLHRGDIKIVDIVQHVLQVTNEAYALGWALEILRFLGLSADSPSGSKVPLAVLRNKKILTWLKEHFSKRAVMAFSCNGGWAQYRARSFQCLDAKEKPDAKAVVGMLRPALDFAGMRLRGVSEKGAKRAVTGYEMYWLWDICREKGQQLPKPRPLHPKDFVAAALTDGDGLGSQGAAAHASAEGLLSHDSDFEEEDDDDQVFDIRTLNHAHTPANLRRTDSSALLPPAPKRHAVGAATPQLDAPSAGRPSKRRVSSVPLFSLDPDATGSPAKDYGKPKPAKVLCQAHSDSDEEVLVSPRWRNQRSKSSTGSKSSLPP